MTKITVYVGTYLISALYLVTLINWPYSNNINCTSITKVLINTDPIVMYNQLTIDIVFFTQIGKETAFDFVI